MSKPSYYHRCGASSISASALTASRLNPSVQHGTMPAVVLTHLVNRLYDHTDYCTTRVTVRIIRPVPVGRVWYSFRSLPLTAESEVLSARLLDSEGRFLAVVDCWRLPNCRTNWPSIELPGDAVPGDLLPHVEIPKEKTSSVAADNYEESVHRLSLELDHDRHSAGITWICPKVSVVDGSVAEDWERLLLAVNTLSLDPTSALFGNTNFTDAEIHLSMVRQPVQGWIGMRSSAANIFETGSTNTSSLFDMHGRVASAIVRI